MIKLLIIWIYFNINRAVFTAMPANTHTASACAGYNITLSCQLGYFALPQWIFHGKSESSCSFQQNSCIHQDYRIHQCTGLNFCQTEIKEHKIRCRGEKEISNYSQIQYKCVNSTEVKDVCPGQTLQSLRGYIATPSYPKKYHKQSKPCLITLRAPFGFKINIYVIDLDLGYTITEENYLTCQDQLALKEIGSGGQKPDLFLCTGDKIQRGQLVYTSRSSELYIYFYGGYSDQEYKGFLLYYEVTPRSTSTGLPESSTVTQSESPHTSTIHPVEENLDSFENTSTVPQARNNDDKKLTTLTTLSTEDTTFYGNYVQNTVITTKTVFHSSVEKTTQKATTTTTKLDFGLQSTISSENTIGTTFESTVKSSAKKTLTSTSLQIVVPSSTLSKLITIPFHDNTMGDAVENMTHHILFNDGVEEASGDEFKAKEDNDSKGALIGGILTALLVMCIAVTIAILYIHYQRKKKKESPSPHDTPETLEDNWPSQDIYENVSQNNHAYTDNETQSSQGGSSTNQHDQNDLDDDNIDDTDEEIDDPIYSVPHRADSMIDKTTNNKSHLKTFKGSDLEEDGANVKGPINGIIQHYYDTGTDSHSDVTSWDTDGYDSENIYDDILYEITPDGQLLYDIVESSPPNDVCPLYSEVPPEIHKELQSILELDCDIGEENVKNGDIKSQDEVQNDQNTLKERRRAKVKPPLMPKPILKPKPKLHVTNTGASQSPRKKYRGKKPPLKPKPKLPIRKYDPSEVPNDVRSQNLGRNDTCKSRLSNDSTVMVENELYHSAIDK